MAAPRWLSVMLYVGMGWLVVIAAPAFSRVVGAEGLLWSLAGGLVYSVGALIYGLKRPNPIPEVFGFHELWHLLVIGGSICHFWVMLRYIAPLT